MDLWPVQLYSTRFKWQWNIQKLKYLYYNPHCHDYIILHYWKLRIWRDYLHTIFKTSAIDIITWDEIVCYRFSAFWLRSKCSICSYQLNIWYVPHWGTTILNWFLELGQDSGACSDLAAGWPGIAVLPGSAHLLNKRKYLVAKCHGNIVQVKLGLSNCIDNGVTMC